ncbi:hypothetical protein [Eisenbergiella sp.]
MKRKITIAIILIVIAAALLTLFCTRRKVYGNINVNVQEERTSSSDFSFTADKGDRLKISLRTHVKTGTVDVTITDSKGKIVKELDHAKALETYMDVEYDDTYTVTAVYTQFTGKFKIKVSTKRF